MQPCLALAASVALLLVVGMAQAFVPVLTPAPRSAAANTALCARGSPSAGDKDIVVSRQGFLGGVLSGACVHAQANEAKTGPGRSTGGY